VDIRRTDKFLRRHRGRRTGAVKIERCVDFPNLFGDKMTDTEMPSQTRPPWLLDHVYIIAEVGPNHDGNLDNALRIIEQVAASGADAVKFQTFASARSVVALGAPLAAYMKASEDHDDQEELLERIRLSYNDFRTIANFCAAQGIAFLSTPFDEMSVDFLVELGVPLLKMPSGEITNGFLLKAAAKSSLPLIVSTGMADEAEIAAALDLIRATWQDQGHIADDEPDLALLHCTSAYPAPFASVNLRAMSTLLQTFGLPVGYSDHTIGRVVPVAAVANGARIIEKHVTPDPNLPGPDHAASLPLSELPTMVAEIRQVEAALGGATKAPTDAEQDVKRVARRAIVAAEDIAPGTPFTLSMLTALRPGNGLSPMLADRLIGRPATRAYRTGEFIDPKECG
jgi:N,N'-diacetyllegionaminate synthase